MADTLVADVGGESFKTPEAPRSLDENISGALAVIDKGLGELAHRELVSTNEVADLLLDARTELTRGTVPDTVDQL